MDEELEKACDVVEPDVTTEEGKKQYLEMQKDWYKQRLRREKEHQLKKELNEQAKAEVVKELGITEEEYDSALGIHEYVSEREYTQRYANLDDEQCMAVAERIRLIQERQNRIINIMICKATHVDAEENGTRNAFVTEYLDLEKSKATQLDILSSAYLKSDGALNVVNERGSKFSKGE